MIIVIFCQSSQLHQVIYLLLHFLIGLQRVPGLQKMQEQINQLMKLLTLAKVDIIAKIPQSSGKRTLVNRRDGAIFSQLSNLQDTPTVEYINRRRMLYKKYTYANS